ncbi:hypothetical protein SEEN2TTA_20547 [Salmonella enterica subsp. enterica serovar Newport str. Pond080-2TTA]|nr:hypothetical protein SEEN2TTA_20547 [Salmonella enterica subsp. enterica serovar Newport str. Pond080-2TTA]
MSQPRQKNYINNFKLFLENQTGFKLKSFIFNML